MKIVTFTIQAVFIALMIGVAGLFLLPLLPIDNNIQLRIVESGSMEPNIMTGSLVLIVPAAEYKVGDVVTFTSQTADVPTTHRLIESMNGSGANLFVTKGDANEEADSAPANAKDILGKVWLTIPFAGFILDFARQPMGFSLLIVLPALMIIFNEIEKIWMEIKSKRKLVADPEDETGNETELEKVGVLASASGPVKMMDVRTPVQYKVVPTLDLRFSGPIEFERPAISLNKNHYGQWATVFVAFLGSSIFVTASFLPYTASYFNDIERSVSNSLRASLLDFTASTVANAYSFNGVVLDNDDSSIVTVVEPSSGSMDVKYDVRGEFVSGSITFCDEVMADIVVPFAYSGPLVLLAASDVTINDPLSLLINLNNSSAFTAGEMCQVDIVYTAWNSNGQSGEGYSDEERISLTFSAPLVLAPVVQSAFILSTFETEEESATGTEQKSIVEEEVTATSTPEVVIEESPAEDTVITEAVPETPAEEVESDTVEITEVTDAGV